MATNEGSRSAVGALGAVGGLSWGLVAGALVTAGWLVLLQSFVGVALVGVAALAAGGLLTAVATPERRAFGAGLTAGAVLCYLLLLGAFVSAVGS